MRQRKAECWVRVPVLPFNSPVILSELQFPQTKGRTINCPQSFRTGFGLIGGIFPPKGFIKGLPNVSYIYIGFIAGLSGADSASIQGL